MRLGGVLRRVLTKALTCTVAATLAASSAFAAETILATYPKVMQGKKYPYVVVTFIKRSGRGRQSQPVPWTDQEKREIVAGSCAAVCSWYLTKGCACTWSKTNETWYYSGPNPVNRPAVSVVVDTVVGRDNPAVFSVVMTPLRGITAKNVAQLMVAGVLQIATSVDHNPDTQYVVVKDRSVLEVGQVVEPSRGGGNAKQSGGKQ